MSDARLRELARRATQGDPAARAALTRARARTSAISEERLRLAAFLGDEAMGPSPGPPPAELAVWLAALAPFGQEVLVRAGLAASRAFNRAPRHPERSSMVEARRAADAWLECPCDRHAAAAGVAAGLPGRAFSSAARFADAAARCAADPDQAGEVLRWSGTRIGGQKAQRVRDAVTRALLAWALQPRVATERELAAERLRAALGPERLRLAAHLGDPAARDALGEHAAPSWTSLPLPDLVLALKPYGPEAYLRAALVALGHLDPRPAEVTSAIERWLACPCEAHAVELRAAARAAELGHWDPSHVGPAALVARLAAAVPPPRRPDPRGGLCAGRARRGRYRTRATRADDVRSAVVAALLAWALAPRGRLTPVDVRSTGRA